MKPRQKAQGYRTERTDEPLRLRDPKTANLDLKEASDDFPIGLKSPQ